jgi:hypothetical protein
MSKQNHQNTEKKDGSVFFKDLLDLLPLSLVWLCISVVPMWFLIKDPAQTAEISCTLWFYSSLGIMICSAYLRDKATCFTSMGVTWFFGLAYLEPLRSPLTMLIASWIIYVVLFALFLLFWVCIYEENKKERRSESETVK